MLLAVQAGEIYIWVHLQCRHSSDSHRIGGNRERRVVNNFSFSIAKINVFYCQNQYNGNRKRLIGVHRLRFWQ